MRKPWLILLGIAIGVLIAMPFRWQRGASMPRLSTADSFAEGELDRVIPAVNIDVMSFERAVEEIQRLTPLDLTVDWDAVAACGCDRNALVAVHGTSMSLWQVLEELTEMQSRRAIWSPISYKVVNGRILISKADQCVIAQLYDADDLIFDLIPAARDASDPSEPVTNRERMDALENLIKSNVAPDSWSDWSRAPGRIFSGGAQLYIMQDFPTHRKIQQFLFALRANDAAMPLPAAVEKGISSIHQAWFFPEHSEKLESLLHTPITRVDMDDVPLDQAIDTLQKMSGVTIWANWAVLATANLSRKAPVNVHTRGTPLPSVLRELFSQPIDNIWVGFTLENDIVKVSLGSEAVMTRFYDVRDLVSRGTTSEANPLMDDLMKSILATVAPDSWRGQGGSTGSISQFRGRLLVTQTWANHELIAAELDAFRKNGQRIIPTTLPGDK